MIRVCPVKSTVAFAALVMTTVAFAGTIDAQQFNLTSGDTAAVITPTGDAAIDLGWKNYLQLWKRIQNEPNATAPRRLLGLPLSGSRDGQKIYRPTRPPRGLKIAASSLIRVQTNLLTIDSTASKEQTLAIAAQLHGAYWAWTKIFFPLWRSADSISQTLVDGVGDDQISRRRLGRTPTMRIVLLRDSDQYAAVLSAIDGIENSTGYYDPTTRCSFFYVGDALTLLRSRTHEWTHQLLAEATQRKRSSANQAVGESADFWLVEGIAGYMESLTQLANGETIVGGWDSSRLQYSRQRFVAGQPPTPLMILRAMGRRESQSVADLPRWYSDSIAWSHLMMQQSDRRRWLLTQLADLYGIDSDLQSEPISLDASDMQSFLMIDDSHLIKHPTKRPISDLCLAQCNVTDAGLQAIDDGSQLRWLDLSGCDVTDSAVIKLLHQNQTLEELELTQTKIGDKTIASLNAQQLRILFATATSVSDSSIDSIATMPALQSVDVQATSVSDAGIAKLIKSRPNLNVNPLQIIRP